MELEQGGRKSLSLAGLRLRDFKSWTEMRFAGAKVHDNLNMYKHFLVFNAIINIFDSKFHPDE